MGLRLIFLKKYWHLMIKIFVPDTNCLISAHLFRDSISRTAFDLVIDKGISVHSAETLDEFIKTFSRKNFDRYVTAEHRQQVTSAFEKKSFLIEVTLHINECRDKKDNKFLELAATCGADCIITGDKDLLVLHPFRGIAILSPRDFIKKFQ